jgi:YD repeat-containing protein
MRTFLLLALAAAGLWGQTTIDCNQPANVTFSGGVGQVNLQFQATAGEAIYFRFVAVNADPGFGLGQIPVIADQFGNTRFAVVRNQNPAVAGATPIDMAELTRAGQGFEYDFQTTNSFTLQLVSSNSALAGTLHVEMVRLNRPCSNNVPLTCGKPNAGSISQSTATLPPLRPGQIDTYTFNANSGDLLRFRLLRTVNSGTYDPNTYFLLAVYGSDGHAINLISGNFGGAIVNDYLPHTVSAAGAPLPASYMQQDLTITGSGTLTMLVFEPTGGRGGSYYLSVTKLNSGGCGGGQALSCGSVVDSQLNSPLAINSYTLSATQADVWQFRIARAASSGSFSPFVTVFDALGNQVGTSIGPASASGHAATFANVSIPATATYTVVVGGPLDGSSGGYTITTTRLNKPCAEQALGCSTILDASISGVLRSHVYSLTATAGDLYLIRLLQPDATNLFRPRVDIYDSSGGQVQFINTNDLARQTFTVPADGTYTAVVTDSYDASQSGNYTLSMLRLNRPCNAATLSCGAPAPGNLTRALDSAVYTYTAANAESFSVRMLPTSSVQPAIEIYDSQGNRTGQGISGAFTGVDVIAPPSGTYTIVATDNSKTPGTGTFSLDLVRTKNACGAPLLQGQVVNGVISAATPLVAYTFSASQNDMLSLRSATSTPGFAAQMEIYDPDGNRLDGSVFGLSRKAAAAGVYTAILGASAPRTGGGYLFTWQALNKPVGVSPLACGGTTGGSLAGTNQFRYYSLAADAGDTVRLLFTKTSDNFSPVVELFDPTGTRLAANSDVTQKVSAGGNYLVAVSPSTTNIETGSYTLAYQRPNNPCTPAALTCGQTTLRQVTLPGQLDALTFAGTVDHPPTIRLITRSGNYTPFVEMYNAAGTKLNSTLGGKISGKLPADGTYTLLVRDGFAGTDLGSYRVSLQDDSDACVVTDTEAPAISLVHPTGGEVVPGGASFHIQWLSDDNVGVNSHDIALSTDGGKTFAIAVAGALNGNQQTFDWLVPPDVTPSRTAVLRVTATDAAGNSQSASSDLLTLIGSGFTPNALATYTYDSLNRLIQVKLDDGRVVRYTWDAAGNLVQVSVVNQ